LEGGGDLPVLTKRNCTCIDARETIEEKGKGKTDEKRRVLKTGPVLPTEKKLSHLKARPIGNRERMEGDEKIQRERSTAKTDGP